MLCGLGQAMSKIKTPNYDAEDYDGGDGEDGDKIMRMVMICR